MRFLKNKDITNVRCKVKSAVKKSIIFRSLKKTVQHLYWNLQWKTKKRLLIGYSISVKLSLMQYVVLCSVKIKNNLLNSDSEVNMKYHKRNALNFTVQLISLPQV